MRIAIAVVLFLTIAGCSSTGGTIGGLLPAPKALKGKVEGTLYTAQDNSFRVATPYSDPYEWKYAEVREDRDGSNVTWVIFGPAAFDKNMYHAVLVKHPITGSFDQQLAIIFNNKTKARPGSSFTKLADLRFDARGHRAGYGVFENDKQFLVVALVDHGDRFAAIDVDVAKHANLNEDRMRSLLVERSWPRLNTFLESFEPLK